MTPDHGADPGTVHTAAATGTCPACVAIAGISFGITLAATMAGDKTFVSERSRRAMLAALEAAQRELDAGGN